MNGSRPPELRRGRILWARFRGKKGIEEHPAVVLTPTAELPDLDSSEFDETAALITIIGGSTAYPDPPPPEAIELPWHPNRHPKTKLRRRTAVFIGWYDVIPFRNVIGFGGDVPPKQLIEILRRTEEYGQAQG